MVTSEDAVHICRIFSTSRIRFWVTGGWGIDALLGKQTREHKDLDILMLLEDVRRFRRLMRRRGYSLKELWEENWWEVDEQGKRTATAFVLQDSKGHEIDAHALHMDGQGNGIPAWEREQGFLFTTGDLSGRGMIGGLEVPCISAEKQMECHTGYELPEYQITDLARLRAKL